MKDKKENIKNSLLEEADHDSLQRYLLLEQIVAIRKANTRGWLWHLGPTLGAIVASITASIIVILFGSQYVKGVVSYYQSNVESAHQEKVKYEKEIENLKASRDSNIQELEKLENEIKMKLANISAIADYDRQQKTDGAIGISVEIQNKKNIYYLIVNTYPPNAKILAFDLIADDFVFPGQLPNIEKSKLFFNVSELNEGDNENTSNIANSPCRVGPIVSFGNDYVWVMAEYNGKQSFKCIHLTGMK